jgi:hypothetical protein
MYTYTCTCQTAAVVTPLVSRHPAATSEPLAGGSTGHWHAVGGFVGPDSGDQQPPASREAGTWEGKGRSDLLCSTYLRSISWSYLPLGSPAGNQGLGNVCAGVRQADTHARSIKEALNPGDYVPKNSPL